MADPKNGRGVKIFGGISLSVVACAFGLFYMISDRAVEKGEAKGTLKTKVEAVEKEITHLKAHADKTEGLLNGKDGLVATVEVLKKGMETLEAQGTTIIEKLDALAKK